MACSFMFLHQKTCTITSKAENMQPSGVYGIGTSAQQTWGEQVTDNNVENRIDAKADQNLTPANMLSTDRIYLNYGKGLTRIPIIDKIH